MKDEKWVGPIFRYSLEVQAALGGAGALSKAGLRWGTPLGLGCGRNRSDRANKTQSSLKLRRAGLWASCA
jgi:hypothetical protein